MDAYREYPIRCRTCNEQIAAYADTYEGLLSAGLTIEDALNELGIMDYCSRNAFMNPTIVKFNMENREVIEGIKSIDAATEADLAVTIQGIPVFTACMTEITPTTAPQVPVATVTEPAPTLIRRRMIGKPETATNVKPLVKPLPADFAATHTEAEIEAEIEELGPGIEVVLPATLMPNVFVEPEVPGIPTINDNPLLPSVLINVGAGKQSKVLNGRTYVCR